MAKAHILVVEDVAITALEIKKFLTKMDYGVTDIVSNYDDALRSIQRRRPDAILLDIGLEGDRDGIELAEAIHKRDAIPFVYLTSDDNESTMARAARTNPSAYLGKPFRREDLQSNLLIALSRTKIQNSLLDIGHGYFYDCVAKNIYFHNKPIHLSINEKSLLEILVNARGTIVSLNIIEEHIWGASSPIAENSLRNLVYRLRSKLKNLPIETIPSFGYQLLITS